MTQALLCFRSTKSRSPIATTTQQPISLVDFGPSNRPINERRTCLETHDRAPASQLWQGLYVSDVPEGPGPSLTKVVFSFVGTTENNYVMGRHDTKPPDAPTETSGPSEMA